MELAIRNLQSQVAELARTLRIMMEILEFVRKQEFAKNHRRWSLYMTRVEYFLIYRPGRQSKKNQRCWEPAGHISSGCMDRVSTHILNSFLCEKNDLQERKSTRYISGVAFSEIFQ